MRTSLALAAAGLLLVAAPALAATRDERPPRDGSTASVPAPLPAPVPAPLPPVGGGAYTHSSGSISSSNTVSTNSGGNSGSHVTTGDQSSSVTVINIGPTDTNSNTVTAVPPEQQPTAPQCGDRMCLRSR